MVDMISPSAKRTRGCLGARKFNDERRMMKKSSLLAAAALTGAAAMILAGCAGDTGTSPSDGGDGGEAEAGRACVILPDAASSPRWENFDRKYLQEGLEAAGFEVDIQNAGGDVTKYSTIADQQLTQGCGVMLLVDYQGAAEAVATKAKGEGIPVIAYDRPFTGADYYVSFDNVEVGRLEGQTVLDGLATAGKDPATAVVVYMGGDPTDGNAIPHTLEEARLSHADTNNILGGAIPSGHSKRIDAL